MKTKFTLLTTILLLTTPFIAKYFHVSLVDAIMAVVGIPLIAIMAYNIWKMADVIDRWSDNK